MGWELPEESAIQKDCSKESGVSAVQREYWEQVEGLAQQRGCWRACEAFAVRTDYSKESEALRDCLEPTENSQEGE
jgi:hypothetical protein